MNNTNTILTSIRVDFNTQDQNNRIFTRTLHVNVNLNDNVSVLMECINEYITVFKFDKHHILYNMNDDIKLEKNNKISEYNTKHVYVSCNPDLYYMTDNTGKIIVDKYFIN